MKTPPILHLVVGLIGLAFNAPAASAEPPNIILIFCDDLGYGDLQSYGHPSIRTPNLDRMAAEGTRFTDFYVAASVCTPSRAALLTGRLPVRSGMCSDTRRVLFPDSAGGLPVEELTIPEVLKPRGYATALIGKWHLGHLPQFSPLQHGFDQRFGLPYSNDMDGAPGAPRGAVKRLDAEIEWWNVPLLREDEIVERPAKQATLTRRYTEEALAFIRTNRERPFFLYLPHTMPHTPLFRSPKFAGRSLRGVYGDVIEELDWSVGEILNTLRDLELAGRTLVFFTSDNGPWLTMDSAGGSAGLLREGKGSTWEGGMRVPAIAWWPEQVPAGRVTSELMSTLDLMPTFAELAGGSLPRDREYDGVDQTRLLLGKGTSRRDTMFFYRGTRIFAVRHGAWKAHYITQSAYGGDQPVIHETPLLFNVVQDPSERFDVAASHPEVIEEIDRIVARHREKLVPGKPQLDTRVAR